MSKKRLCLLWGLSIAALLPGCKVTKSRSHRTSNQATIEVRLLEKDSISLSSQNHTFERQWTSPRQWHTKPSQLWLNLETTYDAKELQSTHQRLRIEEENIIAWPSASQPDDSIRLQLESDLGAACFSGETEQNGAAGRLDISVYSEPLAKLDNVFGDTPSLDVAFWLICKQVDTADLMAYANCGVKINMAEAGDLARYSFLAANIQALVDTGHRFQAKEYVELARYHVSPEYIITWKKHGYDLSTKQLVYAHNRNLKADMAKQWKDVGYDVTLEKVYWIKNRNLKPDSAVEWKDAGCALTLEKLEWVKNRNLKPASAVEWRQVGYDLNLEQLYWIKNRNLKSTSALAVGVPVTRHPPHSPGRAVFPHPVLRLYSLPRCKTTLSCKHPSTSHLCYTRFRYAPNGQQRQEPLPCVTGAFASATI